MFKVGACSESVSSGWGRQARPSYAERFDNAFRKTFTVSKEEMQRREAEWQKTQGQKQPKKPV
jgi:hypothetical protein